MSSCEYHIKDYVISHCETLDQDMEAQIVEIKDNGKERFAYIHFSHQDKRLDRWVPINQLSPFNASMVASTEDRVLSRRERALIDGDSDDEELQSKDIREFEELHNEVTKIRNIEFITIGPYTIRTWYFAPYPKPFFDLSHIFVCEHCFRYFQSQEALTQH